MAERVQVILKREEKIRLQRQAEREGTSLSAWLRRVAIERLAQTAEGGRFEGGAELRAFFKRCAAIDAGEEPDWDVHRAVIEQSRRSGGSGT
jgi:hypothetical protein